MKSILLSKAWSYENCRDKNPSFYGQEPTWGGGTQRGLSQASITWWLNQYKMTIVHILMGFVHWENDTCSCGMGILVAWNWTFLHLLETTRINQASKKFWALDERLTRSTIKLTDIANSSSHINLKREGASLVVVCTSLVPINCDLNDQTFAIIVVVTYIDRI